MDGNGIGALIAGRKQCKNLFDCTYFDNTYSWWICSGFQIGLSS
jgi:hypothetical protein